MKSEQADETLYKVTIYPKLSVEGVDIKQYIIGCQRSKTKKMLLAVFVNVMKHRL